MGREGLFQKHDLVMAVLQRSVSSRHLLCSVLPYASHVRAFYKLDVVESRPLAALLISRKGLSFVVKGNGIMSFYNSGEGYITHGEVHTGLLA